jgi:hypothetical protein
MSEQALIVPESGLITLKQLPIIEQQLTALMPGILAEVESALALPVNEDTRKEVKRVRTKLNQWLESFEAQRKKIKIAYDGPWDVLMQTYGMSVKEPLSTASKQLGDRIAAVEAEINKRMEDEIKQFFADCAVSNNIEWLTYEQSGIKVMLSDTKPALMRECERVVGNVAEAISFISTEQYADEIMVEFKNAVDEKGKHRFNSANAILAVRKRHAEIEKAAAERAKADEAVKQQAEVVAKVERVIAPADMVAEQDENEVLTRSFTITDTRKKIRMVREFMIKEGINYGR